MRNIFRTGNTHGYAPMLICACTIFATALVPTGVSANENLEELAQRVGVRIIAEATSDRDVLAKCKSQIPYSNMSPRSRQRVSHIITNLSQYRRMPSLQYEVNPGIYQYLINHPDVAISTWRVMGISKLQMFQTGEFEYEASAADGSKGIADILWRDGNQCLFIVQGTYSSPLLPGTIDASALVWLRYRFVNSKDGKVMVNQQVETFISFPSQAVDTLAKLATMVTNTILDRNVFEVSLYARMMSTAAAKEPEWIAQVAERMDGVLPQRAVELVRVSRGQNPVLGSVLPPAGIAADRKTAGLPNSGAFHTFESSMSHVESHVPLSSAVVEPPPNSGRSVGESSSLMASPHGYVNLKSGKAVTPQPEREWSSRQDGADEPVAFVPAAIPPARESAASGEVAELPSLAYANGRNDSFANQKAMIGGIPISPSAPIVKSGVRAVTRPAIRATPVSVATPAAADNMLSAELIAMPPVPPGETN